MSNLQAWQDAELRELYIFDRADSEHKSSRLCDKVSELASIMTDCRGILCTLSPSSFHPLDTLAVALHHSMPRSGVADKLLDPYAFPLLAIPPRDIACSNHGQTLQEYLQCRTSIGDVSYEAVAAHKHFLGFSISTR